ncbi:MAG TPA: sulfate adenylyltransferase subunit CysN [Gammaproteobacteria bacterium]|jgi:bifunctional enzyme CysN/CysC|nr:sulfate adenylyltransferase subunit CysN [Gammaproteobacteria bacterium]
MVSQQELIRNDIEAYLHLYQKKGLLRFITCGSVDDGKSTLIGRLLYDTDMIFDDHLQALEKDSRKHGTTGEQVDLALLVDGLQSEREQGITIDVAYRYFATDRRKFIIADTPGHEQYTRNMATGASTANLAVILIDARKGVLTQTRRHSFIASLLGIRHAVVAVNKMDLVGWDKTVFERITADYRALAASLDLPDIHFVPVSALKGENVVHRGDSMPWYAGPTLLDLLETINVTGDVNFKDLRLPVQYVNRPNLDFRGYCGTLAAGVLKKGDEIMVLPSRRTSRVTSILGPRGELDMAYSPAALTVTLADEIDISRGDVLVHGERAPHVNAELDAWLIWMADAPMLPGKQYLFKLNAKTVSGVIEKIHHVVDVNTLEKDLADELKLNQIAQVRVKFSEPAAFDPYAISRSTGCFIVIDRLSNGTVGAGMMTRAVQSMLQDRPENVMWHVHKVSREQRANQKSQQSCAIWLTGLSGSGKSSIANMVEQRLHTRGYHTYLLDGDNIRHGLNRDLDFSDTGRVENIRRIGEVAKLFVDAGVIVLTAFISPFRSDRRLVRDLLGDGDFIEIFVDTPLEVCESRDPKGLYKKAREGLIRDFTGIDSPYEAPQTPELVLRTVGRTPDDCADELCRFLVRKGILKN